ncbi:MAG: hypothetical protein HOE90_06685 [Bacteriovoracaceae bacterium]|nr:hypothetical protein [Bacteriovoracaceae bacterium]
MANIRNCSLLAIIFGIFNISPGLGVTPPLNKNIREYAFFGQVYFDQNKNGVKESNEFGIGGVKILSSDGVSATTNDSGRFEIKAKADKFFQEIAIDENTVPAGAVVTTAKSLGIDIRTNFVREINFGLHFPLRTYFFAAPDNETKNLFIDLPSKYSVSFKLDGGRITINDEVTLDRSFPVVKKVRPFYFTYNPTIWSVSKSTVKQLYNFTKSNHAEIDSMVLTIFHPPLTDQNQRSFERLKKEIQISLVERGLAKNKIIFKTVGGNKKYKIKADIDFHSYKECSIGPSQMKQKPIAEGQKITYEIGASQGLSVLVRCGKKSTTIALPWFKLKGKKGLFQDLEQYRKKSDQKEILIPISHHRDWNLFQNGTLRASNNLILTPDLKSETIEFELKNELGITLAFTIKVEDLTREFNRDGKVEQPGLLVQSSKHMENSRDLNVFFRFTPKGIKSYQVTIPKKEAKSVASGIHYAGEKEGNHLEIELTDLRNRSILHEINFNLLHDAYVDLKVFYGMYNARRRSTFLKTENIYKGIYNYGGELNIFPFRWLGFGGQYYKDRLPLLISTLSGQKIKTYHKESRVYLAAKLFFQKTNYLSPRITFMGGLHWKKFNPGQKSIPFYAKDFYGAEIGVEFVFPKLVFGYATPGITIFYGPGFDHTTNYTYEVRGDLRYSLNNIAKLLPIGKYFDYEEKVPIAENFHLILSGILQNDRRKIMNAPYGKHREQIKGIKLGLQFEI